MHNSKLLRTLKLLESKERGFLHLYLQSEFIIQHKQRAEIISLYKYIDAALNSPTKDLLTKVEVYNFLFLNEKLVKGKLEKLMSVLLQYIHRFIAAYFKEEKLNAIEEMLTLSQFFRERKAYDLYQMEVRKMGKEKSVNTQKDKAYYYRQFIAGTETYQFEVLKNQTSGVKYLADSMSALDIYYLLSKLESICYLLSIHKFRQPVDIQMHIDFLEKVKPLYAEQGLFEVPIIAVYFKLFETLKEDQKYESAYSELKEMIHIYKNVIPFDSLKILNDLSRNFIIYLYNQGKKELENEIFDLYKSQLEAGFLEAKTGLLPATFKNIVTIALRQEEYEWSYWFLNTYRNKIEGGKEVQDIYDFNLATYYFKKGEYDNAMSLLSDQYEDLFYKLAAKRLEIKIYFETASEILDAKMDAFKLYVYRLSDKNLLNRKIKSNNNFINFLRRIRNPKTRIDNQRIQKLKSKISACKHLSEKEWLIEKLEF